MDLLRVAGDAAQAAAARRADLDGQRRAQLVEQPLEHRSLPGQHLPGARAEDLEGERARCHASLGHRRRTVPGALGRSSMSPMTELVFVMARRQNRFFVELMEALRDELGELGVASSVALDGFPEPRRGLVNVLLPPHEYFELRAPDGATRPRPAAAFGLHLCRAARLAVVRARRGPGQARRGGDGHQRVGDARVEGAPRGASGAPAARLDAAAGTAPRSTASATSTCSSSALTATGALATCPATRSHSGAGARTSSCPTTAGPTTTRAPTSWSRTTSATCSLAARCCSTSTRATCPISRDLRLVDAIHCGAVVVSEHSAYTAPFAPGARLLERPPGEPDARRAGAARERGPAGGRSRPMRSSTCAGSCRCAPRPSGSRPWRGRSIAPRRPVPRGRRRPSSSSRGRPSSSRPRRAPPRTPPNPRCGAPSSARRSI